MEAALYLLLLLKLFIGFGNVYGDCDSPLGMENGNIPNSDITASSEYSNKHAATNARLNNQGVGGKNSAWSAKTLDKNQWLQVNLHELTRVTKVAIQGRKEYNQYITQFKISYSLDGTNFIFQDKVYQGNNDQSTVVANTLIEPIEARYIRLHPVAWHGHISLRMELYGCKVESGCDAPLGMENGNIPNSGITASSEYSNRHAATNARLNNQGGGGMNSAWSAKTSDKNQWIQVDLRDLTRVTKVATQGRKEYKQYVTEFKISYSVDGTNFIFQDKIYQGNKDQNTVVVTTLIEPIEARYIRLHPFAWHSHISLRMELYGCKVDSGIKNGGYSNWSSWSQCSVTCRSGQRSRSRSCTNPPPGPGGKECSQLGPEQEFDGCNHGECPVNGGYSSWHTNGECSQTCGGGKISTKRTCTNPPPANGGKDCSGLGPSSSFTECNAQDCPICGDRIAISARIVMGVNARPHSWPWQISLRQDGHHICGGSLIKSNWVLTAAHCVYRSPNPSKYTVVVGAHKRTGTTDVQQSLKVKQIINHPEYNQRTLNNDLALLELEEPATLSKKVNLVCLPQKGTTVELGKRCYITGWGKTIGEDNYSAADTLQQAILPVASQKQCHEKNSNLLPVVESTMVCAGSGEANQAGGCQGDSGGPFVCEEGGKWVLRGAVSWGNPKCKSDYYTVFARVSTFVDWISNHIDSCVDRLTTCNHYIGYCSTHAYVKDNCKKSCNLC